MMQDNMLELNLVRWRLMMDIQVISSTLGNHPINGNFRILKWRYVSTILLAKKMCGDSLKFSFFLVGISLVPPKRYGICIYLVYIYMYIIWSNGIYLYISTTCWNIGFNFIYIYRYLQILPGMAPSTAKPWPRAPGAWCCGRRSSPDGRAAARNWSSSL